MTGSSNRRLGRISAAGLVVASWASGALWAGVSPAFSIQTMDYSDTFTGTDDGGIPGRPYVAAGLPEYRIEDNHGNSVTHFTQQPGSAFSIASDLGPGFVQGGAPAYPTSLAPNASGAGSDTGFTQTGGNNLGYGVVYGLRKEYIVRVDAVQTTDRVDITSGDVPTGSFIAAGHSISVFFRGDGSGGVSVYNGAVDTTIPGFNSGIAAWNDPANGGLSRWYTYAVRFDSVNNEIEISVNDVSLGVVDLSVFGGGAYAAGFSNQFVSVSTNTGDRTWTDNFQVGSPYPNDPIACFSIVGDRLINDCPLGFDAGCSRPAVGSFVSYSWDFGDGGTASGPAVEHTYTAEGTYTVTLTVQNDSGATASASKSVAIAPVVLSYADDFDRAPGAVTGWTVFAGPSWGLSGAALLTGITGTEHWIWAGAPPVYAPANAEYALDYSFLAPGSVAGVGRHGGFQFCCTRPTARGGAGAFSGYFIDWIDRASDRGVRLTRVDNGAQTLLVAGQQGAASADPPARWRVSVQGAHIRVHGDDVLLIDQVDSTHRGGFFGCWVWEGGEQISVDNVSMEGAALAPCISASSLNPLAGTSVDFDASCTKVYRPPSAPVDVGQGGLDCASATPIAHGQIATGSTDGGAPGFDCDPQASPAVYYTTTGTGNILTASLCGSTYDTYVSVQSGDCSALVCIGANDDACGTQSRFSWSSVLGETYIIRVYGWSTEQGDYILSLSDETDPPPRTIVSYDWDFGDGTTASGVSASHSFSFPDVYTVTLVVTDSLGDSAETTVAISVAESLIGFRDCFDRAPGPVDGWTPALGTWTITPEGEVETVTAGEEAFLYAGSPPALLGPDFKADVKWSYLGGTHPVVGRHGAVHFFWNKATTNRFAADSSGYVVFYIERASDRGLTLARFDGAGLAVLNPPGGTPSLPEPPTYLGIEVFGPVIRVYADGILAIEATDNTYRSGLFGLWAWQTNTVRFDSVRIWNEVEPELCDATPGLAGDCDRNGARDLGDILCHIRDLFPGFVLVGTSALVPCATEAGTTAILDVNGDGDRDVSDLIYLAMYLFQGGAPPAQGVDCFGVKVEYGCDANPVCP